MIVWDDDLQVLPHVSITFLKMDVLCSRSNMSVAGTELFCSLKPVGLPERVPVMELELSRNYYHFIQPVIHLFNKLFFVDFESNTVVNTKIE